MLTLLLSQLVQPYYNPEVGGILTLGRSQRIDSADAQNDVYFEGVMKGAVDPYFMFFGTFPLTLNGMELEEAYVKTLTLPVEITLGKFKSRFTRLNSLHPHAWDFPELPSVYNLFWEESGEEGLNLIGVGISTIVPFNFFFEGGIEVFQPSSLPLNGLYPYSLAWVHFSVDLPFSTTLWLSPSVLWAWDTLSVYGAEVVLKRIVPGEERYRGLILTGGYFQTHTLPSMRGGYADVVYKWTYGWRAGVRVDLMYKESPGWTVMADYSPTEFSRFRLSYNLQEKRIFLDMFFSVGPHGAHPF